MSGWLEKGPASMQAASRAPIDAAGAAAELLRRDRAYDSIVGYAEYITVPGAAIVESEDDGVYEEIGTDIAAHHRLFMDKIQEAMTTRYGRLMIFAPPGSAKSTYASVVGPSWYMGRFPGAKMILVSYGADLAKKHGRKARSIIRQPEYQNVFGTKLRSDTSAADMWIMENGSEYMSGGILSGVTGSRASVLLVDDPIKGREEADSATVRVKTVKEYEDSLRTRLSPGGSIIIIQTRWHPDDLAGSILPENYDGRSGKVRCRDGFDWEIINLPAECEHETDPLGRPIGDGDGGVPGSMLWGDYFDSQHWAMHRIVKRTWAALYQQRPRIEEDNEFNPDWVRWYKAGEEPKWLMRYLSSDYAVTEDTKADFTEHGVGGVDKDGNLWLLDWWYGQQEVDTGIRELLRLADKWRIRKGFGEVGVIRRAIEPLFKSMKKQNRGQKGCTHSPNLTIEYLPHIGDKKAKFESFKGMAMSGRVYILDCPWGRRLVEQQLAVFPDSRFKDDGVDVCSLFGRAVDQMNWARPEDPPEEKKDLAFGSWKWLTWDSSKPDGGHGAEKEGPRLW